MIVSDEAAVVDKLYRLVDRFNESYMKKQYPVAMWSKFNASILMLNLMEKGNSTDEELLKMLFGYGNGPDEDNKGLFNRDCVQKAELECIKKDIHVPYVDEITLLRVIELIK